MKALLMHRDHDFDRQHELPFDAEALIQDLELNTLFNAMACGDRFLFEVAKVAVLSPSTDIDTIIYRQNILKDCLNNPSLVRNMYKIVIEAIESEKKNYWSIFVKHPEAILNRSVDVLGMLMGMLRKLRTVADEHAGKFGSAGFRAFFAMLQKDLDDEYFATVQNHLNYLKFHQGILIAAALGPGNKGTDYMLCRPPDRTPGWIERVFTRQPRYYTFTLDDRDEAGFRALAELRDRGLNPAADALARSADHILAFLAMLRAELAFYVGCLNLYDQLTAKTMPVSFPLPAPAGERRHSCRGLYDVGLALTMEEKVVPNDLSADGKRLVLITGANRGGKSTFLRSVGLAQLMMQCGMFVPAESFAANVCDGLFTHYQREEDPAMTSGKFDEELARMSAIVDHLRPGSLLLCNESFAATNEREGSEIAAQIVRALVEKGIKVFFVSHMYEFARGWYDRHMDYAVFLRAERQGDATRTFRIVEGEPLPTSFGRDLYDRIFVD